MARGLRSLCAVVVAVSAWGCGGPPAAPGPPPGESDHDAESAVEAVLVRLAEEEAGFVRGLSSGPAPPTYPATLRIDGRPPPPELMRRLGARELPALRFVPAGEGEADYELATAAGGDGSVTVRVRDRNPRHRSAGSGPPPDEVLAVTRLGPGRWRVSEAR